MDSVPPSLCEAPRVVALPGAADRPRPVSRRELRAGQPGEPEALPLKVLIVEDNERDAELIVRHLRQAGYAEARAVITAENLPSEQLFGRLGFTRIEEPA